MLEKKRRVEKRAIVAISREVKAEACEFANKNNYTLVSVIETAIKEFLSRKR